MPEKYSITTSVDAFTSQPLTEVKRAVGHNAASTILTTLFWKCVKAQRLRSLTRKHKLAHAGDPSPLIKDFWVLSCLFTGGRGSFRLHSHFSRSMARISLHLDWRPMSPSARLFQMCTQLMRQWELSLLLKEALSLLPQTLFLVLRNYFFLPSLPGVALYSQATLVIMTDKQVRWPCRPDLLNAMRRGLD